MLRRSFLFGLSAAAAREKVGLLPPDWTRYLDPATEFEVARLTDPRYTSYLPAYYARALSRRNDFLLFACDRSGSMQAHQLDLKTGETRQLTEASALDRSSLTLLPGQRGFCYFDGPVLRAVGFGGLRGREVYRVPEGWERCAGASVSEDGLWAVFGERQGDKSRLRVAAMNRPGARTVLELNWPLSDPIMNPRRAQILYRQASEALWLIHADGGQNRRLRLADGRVGPANWSPDGRNVLYLNLPADPTQLNAIREHVPDLNADRLVGRTSQFVHFGFNRDTSVFVGASRNRASPHVLLLLRVTRREFTLCEHRASDPAAVAPIFSHDSQNIYFSSDRHGKPAIYSMRVEKLVERTESG